MSRPKLFQYQVKASEFIRSRSRSLLRLDTGLGKTAVCIDAAKKLDDVKNVLVIAPAFLEENWLREIRLWEGHRKPDGTELNWHVISYTKMSSEKYLKQIRMTKWDMVVCDEAHYIKNWESKRTKNIILKLLPYVKRVVLSTATPYVRSAADLHPLFSVCEPGKWGKYGAFCEKFCNKKPNMFKRWQKFDYFGVKEATAGELKSRSKAFTISYKKGQVLKDLPLKMCIDVYIRLGSELSVDNIKDLNPEVIDVETGKVSGGLYSVLSREMNKLGEAKVYSALEWLDNFPKDEPLVIFAKHISVVEDICRSTIRSYHKITGDTSTVLRDKFVQEFQRGAVKTLICTMASCGVGINLTAASSCLFVELPWSYTELKQCEDRLHRIGQRNCVQSYRMIANGTLDEMVVGILNSKIEGEDLSIGALE